MKDKHEEDPRHLLETAWSIKWDQYGKKMKKWVLSFIPHPHMCITTHMHTGLYTYVRTYVHIMVCVAGLLQVGAGLPCEEGEVTS